MPTMESTLRTLVDASGRRQDWIAGRLGVSEAAVSKWISGALRLPVLQVRPLAEALDVPIEQIVCAVEKTLAERPCHAETGARE